MKKDQLEVCIGGGIHSFIKLVKGEYEDTATGWIYGKNYIEYLGCEYCGKISLPKK